MRNPAADPGYELAGEVSERAELLNGSMQLALDGAASRQAEHWQLAIALAWRLGREGAVTIEEGDLALDDGGATDAELVAILDSGTAEQDPDTGSAVVEVQFTIEESNIAQFEAGAQLHCQLEVGAEQWTGSFTLAVSDA